MVFEMVYDIWKFSPESSTDSAVVHVMRAGRFLALHVGACMPGGAAPRPLAARPRCPYAEFHCTWFCLLRADVVFQIVAAASPRGGRPAAGPASSAAAPYVHAFTQDPTVLGPALPALTTRVQQGFSLLAQPTPCAMRPSVHATGIPRTVVVGFLLHPYI